MTQSKPQQKPKKKRIQVEFNEANGAKKTRTA